MRSWSAQSLALRERAFVALSASIRAYAACRQGGMTIFVLVMFLMMVTVGGMAVDFARHEALRADLQNALDRGVLAATNLKRSVTTKAEAEAIIRDYMRTRGWRDRDYGLNVSFQPIPGGREISAGANMTLGTIFLKGTNLSAINVPVISKARQSLSKLEVMLVLDVSNSMNENSTAAPGTKIELLRSAAEKFVTDVIGLSDTNNTLVTIVPYSSQVSWPAGLADAYGLDRVHDYSSCFAFDELDFTTTSFPMLRTDLLPNLPDEYLHTISTDLRTQYQHFIEAKAGDTGNGVTYQYDVHGCSKDVNAILPFSNNVTDLVNKVRGLQTEKWTASYMGVKAAAALLSPEARPIIDDKIAGGQISSVFAGWPRAFTDTATRKVVILMTDGVNTRLHKIHDDEYEEETLEWWHVNRPSGEQRQTLIDNSFRNNYPGDDLLEDICGALKAQPNVTIYTIGFEIAEDGQADTALNICATGTETAFLVDGLDIVTAFDSIRASLGDLKLVQ